MKKLLLLFVAAMALMGCKKEKATASFSLAKPNYYLTEPVIFTNSSSNASKYDWDFGDGQVSSEESPTHAYATAGTYQVTLKANGDAVLSKTIKIYPGNASYEIVNSTMGSLPMVSFSADANNNIIDFIDHGYIAAGNKSDTVFTSRATIYMGGFIGTKTFIAVPPYSILRYKHNKITLLNTTQMVTSSLSQLPGNLRQQATKPFKDFTNE